MPNHVSSLLTITGPDADIDAFIAAHLVSLPDDDHPERVRTCFDFRTVVPMPASVESTEDGSEAEAGFYALTGLLPQTFAWSRNPMEDYARDGFELTPLSTPEHFRAWLQEHRPQAIAKGERQLAAYRETGHRSWYGWALANWGTKWNAYDYARRQRDPGRFAFKFETAWSVPVPVLEKLASRWPTLLFDIESIDEGGPEYAGRFFGNEHQFQKVDESRERYVRVYGREPDPEEEE